MIATARGVAREQSAGRMLLAACPAAFLATLSALALSPFLPTIAEELHTSVALLVPGAGAGSARGGCADLAGAARGRRGAARWAASGHGPGRLSPARVQPPALEPLRRVGAAQHRHLVGGDLSGGFPGPGTRA